MLRMVHEGSVIALPNETGADTVLGGLCYALGFVGMWNGVAADGKDCPAIVNHVVQVPVTAGADAIERGAKLNLNTATMELELAAAGVDEDADGDADGLVFFGTVTKGSLLANEAGTLWVKIKPQ